MSMKVEPVGSLSLILMLMNVACATAMLSLVMLAGCAGGDGPPPPPTATAAPVVTATPIPPLMAVKPEALPREPTRLERAQVAMNEARYEDVCAYLIDFGLSPVLCGWVVETVRANDDRPFSSDRFERALRDQHVRRVSGTIVGWYNEARNEYEVRVGGRTAILVATESGFETTGRFSMWAQQNGTSEETLASGREVSVPVYREWPLYHSILEMARARGDAAGPAAVALLRELLRGWESDYCYAPSETGECYVDPAVLAEPGAASDPDAGIGVDASAPVVSDERRRECRRACASYLSCRELGLPLGDCREDINAACRACREEGAVR